MVTTPRLSPSELGAWYAPTYYGTNNRRFNPLFEGLIRWFRNRRADAIERRVEQGSVLDVGCGRGLLPLVLRDRGWEVHGTELSETAASHARQLGIPVFVGDLAVAPYEPGQFDALVLWHVLEHLPDPAAALAQAHRLLRPGGLLIVAVPNFSSLQASLTGRHWFHLDVPRHTVHYRLPVVQSAIERAGFKVDDVNHFNLEQNPYGWIQSLLNAAGLPHNILYELLKNPTSRSDGNPLARHPVAAVLSVLVLPLLVPLAFGLFALEVLLRSGGTVEVYARAARRRTPGAGAEESSGCDEGADGPGY